MEKWDFGERVLGHFWDSMIDQDGNVVAAFKFSCPLLLTPKEVITIATEGQGPNQIVDLICYLDMGDRIGLLEYAHKMQIYIKKSNRCFWKETLWLKQTKRTFLVKSAIYYDKKFFFAGPGLFDENNEVEKFYNMMIYQEKGQPIKTLLYGEIKIKERRSTHLMDYHIAARDGLVYYIPENDFTVTVISAKDLMVVKSVKLETPSFYKPLPKDFYRPTKRGTPDRELELKIESWMVGYSRINKMVIENDNIVLQIRTCDPKLKRFCLLFYDIHTFKQVNQVFTDDLFLGARYGKYYFFAGGDPSLDQETDRCVIHIYQFKQIKGK